MSIPHTEAKRTVEDKSVFADINGNEVDLGRAVTLEGRVTTDFKTVYDIDGDSVCVVGAKRDQQNSRNTKRWVRFRKANSSVITPPCYLMAEFLKLMFTKKYYERVAAPIIADEQDEWERGEIAGRHWGKAWITFRSLVRMTLAVAASVGLSFIDILRPLESPSQNPPD